MIPFVSYINRFTLCKRMYSFSVPQKHTGRVLYPLKKRGLFNVKGPDAAEFLQRLITNDMNNLILQEGAKSMYAMFLNNKGRVLYDTIIHKWRGETGSEFMLECDTDVKNLLEQYLDMAKSKQHVKIEDVSELYKLWALIAPPKFDKDFSDTIFDHEMNVYKDPRLADLGHRLITPLEMGQINIRQVVGQDTATEYDEQEYRAMRYRLGVSEGADDLYPGTCCPLEFNCDYLHGMSFQKTYYTGQEYITDRIDKGGVRERIMPIRLLSSEEENNEELEKDAKIWANRDCGKLSVGKLKNYVGSFGLGLLKVEQALRAKTLHIGSNPIVINQPHWWPRTSTSTGILREK